MKMNRVLALILSSVMICTAVPGEVMAAEIELESEEDFSDEVGEFTELESGKSGEVTDETVDEIELQNEELDEIQALEFEDNADEENLFADEKTEEKAVLAKGEVGTGEWILYDDGEFIINGTYVPGYSRESAPWYRYHNQIKKIVVEEGINRIERAAFYGCDNVQEVDIADTVTSIEYDAFRNCTKLQAIILPHNLTKMDDSAFRDCKSLEKVEIPESLTSIPPRTFMGCSSLEDITLPKSITAIGDSVFENCSNLRQIQLPEGISAIPVSAFYNCKKLYEVYIPQSVERIETNAFGDCESLVNVQIPKGVKYIDSVAFDGCKSLRIVEILGALNRIETNVFLSCEKLEIIRYGGSFEEWNKFKVSVNANVGIYCDYNIYHSHVYEPKIIIPATCMEAGVVKNICKLCGDNYTEEIKATGHKEVKDATVAATCEKAGKTEGSHCSVCNKVIKAQKEVPALGHSWDAGKITKAATCTETGVKTYTCTRCQKTKTEEIKATGHKEVKDAAVAATCEKAGKSEGSHCSVCSKVIKAQKEVPALGHSWDAGKITKAATCTETGVKTYTCTRCKKTKTEEIKATGHKFSAWKTSSKATIYSPAKQTRECTSCHKKQIRDTGKKLKATIKVSASKITMQPQQKLGTLKVTFANGDSVKSWKSSNQNIFKVVGKTNGKCTLTAGRTAGTAKLTIKLKSGLTKDVSIKVKSVKTTKISSVKSAITLKVKKTTTLKPVLVPKNSTEKITYKSSNSKIVTVNAAGKVVAKKKGTAYIYVKSGSKTVKCKVVVK
nr:leucine-rich repeat protein [uncultured Blautia sp.]